jgi:lactose/L-arabinose transport system permease protein
VSTGRFLPVWQRIVIGVIAIGGALVFLLPLWWNIMWTSWNTGEIFSFPPKFLPGPFLVENFVDLQSRINIVRVFLNSVVITALTLAGALFFCTLAGFAFAKYRFPLRDALFYILLATMAIPGQITAIPLYVIMLRLGWVDTYQAVIIPGLVPAFGVFLMRQSIQEAIPDEMLQAARVDGANELRIFFQIATPNLLPHIAALSIFLFTASWSNLFWPLIVLRSSEMFTLPVALATLIGSYEQPYDVLMAGSLLSILPALVLFLALQRLFVKSLVFGSFK